MSWLVVMWFALAIFSPTLVGNDEIGVTKNAREAAIVDANLHPDRCFHYNASSQFSCVLIETSFSEFEDDIYLDKGEKVAIIIQNITDELPVVKSCGTISNFCSHMPSQVPSSFCLLISQRNFDTVRQLLTTYGVPGCDNP